MASFTTASFVGLGQQLEYNGADIVDHITDVNYSGSKVDTADNTDTSAVNGYRTFIPGLLDAGECQVKGIWYPGDVSQEGLNTLKGTVATWIHTLPNSLGTVSFNGMVTGFDHTAPLDKAGEFTLKIKVSGPTTYSHS
jgi:hypothetical protein